MSTDVAAPAEATAPRTPAVTVLLGLPLLRVALVALAAVITWLLLLAAGERSTFPPSLLFGAAIMLPVNVVSLVLVRRALHREGLRARDLIGFSWRRLGADIAWGLLWLSALSLPFALAIMGMMFALHGGAAFERFDTVFYDEAATPTLDRALLAALAIVSVVTFAPLNAPAEELVYRGYSQGGLVRRWPAAVAVLVPAIVFAVQHVFYAATPSAVPVYLVAYLVWGIGSGLIVLWQRRLMPIIVAHFLVNLMTSAPALVLTFLPEEAFVR
ncbi:CPBP family intramembrane glutamic endopeptidase [Agromyces albus]|uniref:CPBP family intramembrane metalloprotease n=1 Tax=Agromyces albus TaxID=205332 RepID=A0A4Q2KNE7_9MICO|nr:type II CAAX endopeptidase family protein [Agromyces albus]RXZ66884.1 CPBP family intramembrane metalloprotease [Agromyces albus]